MRIEKLIGDYIDSHGMTVSDLAEVIGVHRNTVARWRDGAHEPSAPQVVQLLDAVKATATQRADVWSGIFGCHPAQLARIVGAI